MEKLLSSYGRCVRLPSSRFYPEPVGAHPDTLIGKIDAEILVCDKEESVKKALDDIGAKYKISNHTPGEKYPLDCGLNFLTLEEKLIGRLDIISSEAKEYAISRGYELINIKQGYAKCSCLAVRDKIITADEGICRALRPHGIDVIKITSGNIDLNPFEYGFIGGACGMIDDDTIMFFGDIRSHPDGDTIERVIRDHSIDIVGFDGKLCDFGGFISFSS